MSRRRAGARRERGFVLVWFAVVMVLLLSFAAFAVDVANWYRVETGAQKAADAASLGGVVFMPENAGNQAFDTALAIAADNGYGADANTTVLVEQGERPNQLRVKITRRVHNIFAGIMGFHDTDVPAEAVAEYQRPIQLGSPANTFGNQPDCTGTCTNVAGAESPDLWVNVAGPGSSKQKGDGFQAANCGAYADLCPSGGTNLDYVPGAGYTYVVDNTTGSGTLQIDVFDGAFVDVGDHCTTNHNMPGLGPLSGDPARYVVGDGPYCTGDNWFNEGGGPNPDVTFRVRKSNGTSWTTADDTPVPGCPDITLDGQRGDLPTLWNQEEAPGFTGEPIIHDWFRRWHSLCTVVGAEADQYLVHVSSSTGGGHNRMAFRVAKNGSLADPTVSIAGEDKISIYANNAAGTNTEFFLARVLPGAAGRTLQLEFFDTGDAAQQGTITVKPPSAALNPGYAVPTQFDGCTYTPPPGDSNRDLTRPFGPLSATGSGCSVSGVSSGTGWQGQWVTWNVPIPDDYDCDTASVQGCWLKIRFDFPGGNVQDTTTWTATLTGDPVRLVK